MRRSLALLSLLALGVTLTAEAVPVRFPHQGRLLAADGTPLEGPQSLGFALFTEATDGAELWSETVEAEVNGGTYAVVLGQVTPLDAAFFDGSVRFLEIRVAGEPLPQRLPLLSVPYAVTAGSATDVTGGGIVDATEIRVGGITVLGPDGLANASVSWEAVTGVPGDLADGDADSFAELSCGAGETLVSDGSEFACAPFEDHAHDGSDIVSGTIAIDRLPVGTGASEVASGTHTHDAAAITSGTFDATRIPALDAAKIATGSFDPARIPSLDAAKIASGTLDAARLPALDAGMIATGTFNAARIPTLDAAKIGTGTLDAARLPALDAGMIATGTLNAARIPSLDAAKIATGTLDKARLPTLTAADVGALPIGGGTLTGGLTGTSATFTAGVRVGAPSSTTCGSSQSGTVRYNAGNLEFCDGTEWRLLSSQSTGPDGTSSTRAARHCKQLLADYPSTASGDYWIDPDGSGSGTPFEVFCDMTTNGGGWTLVANIAPADGRSAGYNNQAFWSSDAEYGAFSNKFIGDYKSPAAYRLAGDQLLIASHTTANNAAGQLGWRRWPMSSTRTFDSFFTTGIVTVHGTDFCETGNSDAVNVGTTNVWDDIIRQGNCLYSDVNPSSSGHADLIRLTTLPYNNTDNYMSGFASCIDCGEPWQGGPDGGTLENMGIDRAGCASSSCHYPAICRVPSADCVGNYCTTHYGGTSCGTNWNSRFFVR